MSNFVGVLNNGFRDLAFNYSITEIPFTNGKTTKKNINDLIKTNWSLII
jgi:hypothetical protein